MILCARWGVTLERVDGPPGLLPKPKHYQACLSHLLTHDHDVAPWSVGRIEPLSDSTGTLEIGTLTGDTSSRLVDRLGEGQVLRLGSVTYRISGPPVLLDQWDGNQFGSSTEPGDRWRVSFRSPTLVSRRSEYTPWLAPPTIVSSLVRVWNRLYGEPWQLGELDRAALALLRVTDFDLWTEHVDFGYDQALGARGGIEFAASDDAEINRVVGHVLSWARFAGVGARTTHGCGQAEVELVRRGDQASRVRSPRRKSAPVS